MRCAPATISRPSFDVAVAFRAAGSGDVSRQTVSEVYDHRYAHTFPRQRRIARESELNLVFERYGQKQPRAFPVAPHRPIGDAECFGHFLFS